MDNRILKFWKPINSYETELHFAGMFFENGFNIKLEDDHDKQFLFVYDDPKTDPFLQSFRMSCESERGDLRGLAFNANRGRSGHWSLFKMLNSDYIDWAYSQCDISYHKERPLEHHVYLTSDTFIEVLSYDEPDVYLLNP